MIYKNPIANISMNVWNNLIKGKGETRYMHRSPNSSSFGDIFPKVNKESQDTFIKLDNQKYNVPYGDLWGYHKNGYYYYLDCTGLVRRILYDIDPLLLKPFTELSSLIDIERGIVREYPRAKTFYTLFTEDINYKYNASIRQKIKDLRYQLIDMGWIFQNPNKDFSNLKPGDILVKNLKSNKNTGHMGIFISKGTDIYGQYINVIESSSSKRKVSNLSVLIKEFNYNIPQYKINKTNFSKIDINSIKELRRRLFLSKNTDTLYSTEISNHFNIHQLRGISALLATNGGIRLSKWRWKDVKKYIIGRIPNV